MKIKIKAAPLNKKPVLRHLMELYKYDFTEFDPEDVNEHGLYGYKYLDHYWTEEGRRPFLITVDDKYAGFALIREHQDPDYFAIAEFFIMKKYRKRGIGKLVAFHLFDLLEGDWEVAEMEENLPAQVFWRKVIQEYTSGTFKEIRKDNWDGPVQFFSTKGGRKCSS